MKDPFIENTHEPCEVLDGLAIRAARLSAALRVIGMTNLADPLDGISDSIGAQTSRIRDAVGVELDRQVRESGLLLQEICVETMTPAVVAPVLGGKETTRCSTK